MTAQMISASRPCKSIVSGGAWRRSRAVTWLISALALILPPAVAQGQYSAGGAPDVLSQLEASSGMQPSLQVPVLDRVTTLERKYFGQERAGSLMERLQALQNAVRGVPSLDPVPVSGKAAILHRSALGDELPLVNKFPANYVRVDLPDAAQVLPSDYYDHVLKASKGRVIRFKAMPIPVYVTPYPDRGFVSSVIRGFAGWEDRTEGLVRFVQVDDPARARIQVVWKRMGHKGSVQGCTLGAQTIMRYTDRGRGAVSFMTVSGVPVPVYVPRIGPKYVVPPQVIEVNLDVIMARNPRTRYRLLQNVVTHELGHALGLLGHSPYKADMMNAVTDEHSRISDRDIATLIQLYNRKCDIPL